MELSRIVNSLSFIQWIAQSLAIMFLVGGFVVLAVGLSLYFNRDGTLRFFAIMNRWVSMRRTTRPLEIPRDSRPFVRKYRLWLAAAFIFGGLFALYGLALRYDTGAIIFSLRLQFLRPSFASWLVDSIRWVLVVGNVVAIIVGVALAFFPAALESLEERGNRWFSERQLAKNVEAPRLPLDEKVAAHPRAAGLIMAFFGLVLIGTFGLMLLGVR